MDGYFIYISSHHGLPSFSIQGSYLRMGGQLKRIAFHSQLTLVNGVRRVDDEQSEVPRTTAVR